MGCDLRWQITAPCGCVSIHAAQAGCDIIFLRIEFDFIVSIHAAQAGCDRTAVNKISRMHTFQFTQPKRAATKPKELHNLTTLVSIHAAQADCDAEKRAISAEKISFNSRSPSGLRLPFTSAGSPCFSSNSRSPSGLRQIYQSLFEKVSIHAAQVGCDAHFVIIGFNSFVFQFTQPKRAATSAPRWTCLGRCCFNSRSPSGLRPPAQFWREQTNKFQFTQPKRAATRLPSKI